MRELLLCKAVPPRWGTAYAALLAETGLRDEDMCFTLKTIDGKEFAAKPVGTVETRLYYLEHWSEYVGKKATCKYFYYSEEGTPIQPILLHFRPDDE